MVLPAGGVGGCDGLGRACCPAGPTCTASGGRAALASVEVPDPTLWSLAEPGRHAVSPAVVILQVADQPRARGAGSPPRRAPERKPAADAGARMALKPLASGAQCGRARRADMQTKA